jgi:hypothetical protein
MGVRGTGGVAFVDVRQAPAGGPAWVADAAGCGVLAQQGSLIGTSGVGTAAAPQAGQVKGGGVPVPKEMAREHRTQRK